MKHLPRAFFFLLGAFLLFYSVRHLLDVGADGGDKSLHRAFLDSPLSYSWFDKDNFGITNIGFPNVVGHRMTSGNPAKHVLGHSLFAVLSIPVGGPAVFSMLLLLLIPAGVFWVGRALVRRLLGDLKVREWVVNASAVFLVVNPYFSSIFLSYFPGYALGYFLFLSAALCYLKARDHWPPGKHTAGHLLLCMLVFTLLMIFYIWNFVILGVMIFYDLLVTFARHRRISRIVPGFSVACLSLAASLATILCAWAPALFFSESVSRSTSFFFSLPAVAFNGQSCTVANVLRLSMVDTFPHFPARPAEWLLVVRWVLPAMAAGGALFWRTRSALYLGGLTLLGIFLAKGLNPPLSGVNEFIYETVPFMKGFRASSKFAVLMMPGYACFLAVFLDRTAGLAGKAAARAAVPATVAAFVALLLVLNPLFLSGRFEKERLKPDYGADRKKYRRLGKWLEQNVAKEGRIWGWGREEFLARRSRVNRPVAWSSQFARPGAHWMGFIQSALASPYIKAPLAEMLAKANIQCVILDQDLKNEVRRFPPDYETVEAGLKAAPGLELMRPAVRGFEIFMNRAAAPFMMSLSREAIWTVGDLRAFGLIHSFAADALKRPILFFHQNLKSFKRLTADPRVLVLFANKDLRDLVCEMLFKKHRIELAGAVRRNSLWTSQWVHNLPVGIDVHPDTLQGAVFRPSAVSTSGRCGMSAPFMAAPAGRYALMANLFYCREGAPSLRVSVDGTPLASVSLKTDRYSGLKWTRLGEIELAKGLHRIALNNEAGGIAIVDALILAPQAALEERSRTVLDALAPERSLYVYHRDLLDAAARNTQGFSETALEKTLFVPEGLVRLEPETGMDVEASRVSESLWFSAGSHVDRIRTRLKADPGRAGSLSYRKKDAGTYLVDLDIADAAFLTFKMSHSRFWELNGETPLQGDYYANVYSVAPAHRQIRLVHRANAFYRTSLVFSMTLLYLQAAVVLFSFILAAFRGRLARPRHSGRGASLQEDRSP